MIKQKGFLCLMTVLLLLPVAALWVTTKKDAPISFQLASDEKVQSISLWKQKEGCYYVFLPSYADLENVQISVLTDKTVRINGMELRNGMTCEEFAEGISYPFSYTAWGKTWHKEIIFMRSANVAAMYIDTQSGNMDAIHAEKGNKERGSVSLFSSDGKLDYSGDIASIQGRGNATWGSFEKKPYSIRLAEEADLLGMGSAARWILLANANDPSQIRNKVIYDFADCLGMSFSPGSEWVDLYLNGEYAGLYLLSERNEVHPARVNVTEKESFLVSMEIHSRLEAQNYPYVSTATKQYLRVHYPENPTSFQLQNLQDSWQSVENAILAEDDTDPVTGKTWMELIDLDSWVKKYLVEEIFGNYDGCFISQFFYRDGGKEVGKIYAGPVWDYDNTMGLKSHWQLIGPNTMHANRYEIIPGVNTPWFCCLYQKELFYERMSEIYECEVLPLLTGFLGEHIAACSEYIGDSFEMNRIRWNLGDINIYDEATYLQNFMEERVAFLNDLWIRQLPHFQVKAEVGSDGHFGYYIAFSGQSIGDLGVTEDTKCEMWYDSITGEVVDLSMPVTEDMVICTRTSGHSLLGMVRQIMVLVLLMLFGIVLCIDWNWRQNT